MLNAYVHLANFLKINVLIETEVFIINQTMNLPNKAFDLSAMTDSSQSGNLELSLVVLVALIMVNKKLYSTDKLDQT